MGGWGGKGRRATTMISRFVTGTTDVQRGMLTIITRRQSRITLRESSCIRVDLTLAVRREQTDGINGWEVEQINFLEINNSVKLSLRDIIVLWGIKRSEEIFCHYGSQHTSTSLSICSYHKIIWKLKW